MSDYKDVNTESLQLPVVNDIFDSEANIWSQK